MTAPMLFPVSRQGQITLRRAVQNLQQALDRSEGAIKQLQLRGVRNLAKALPEDLR